MNAWKRIIHLVFAVLLLAAPVDAALAQVKVTAATPATAYQGTVSLDVVVTGNGFDRSARVQYFVSGTTNPGGIAVRSVTYRSSTELVTTIDVAETALLSSFDIQVTLDSGRKGKGTTLFSVQAKSTGPAPAPTYPPARKRQGFTSNGASTAASSRLYMFGGTSDGGESDLDDLWAYAGAGSTGATWTLIPRGTSAPSQRHLMGWSCGGGYCVMANGWRFVGWVKETWIFNESTRAWSQVNCGRRVLCPSERSDMVMAYDPVRAEHVLFGGWGMNSELLADTFLFSVATKTWRQASGGTAPPAREGAAAVYVPGAGIVMFGGWGNPCCVTTLNDMHIWNGGSWAPVASTVISDPARAVPTLAFHSMAWDDARNALIVTGGVLTSWHTPNTETWFVTLSNSNGAWQATWKLATDIGCQAAASSPPDAVVHQSARMAYDPVAHVQVFFGGEDPADASVAFGNTVECR